MTLSANTRRAFTGVALLLLTGCATAPVSAPPWLGANTDYRVYDVANRRFVAVAELARAAAEADIVFFGEYHDSEGAHQAQRDFLELIRGGNREAVLGFEMFERDVQPILDHYLDGLIDEAAFLANSRPWPNYATDYSPLVEVAREEGWPVLATNLPQVLATRIGREGLGALDSATAEERRMAPSTIACPQDEYWREFVEALTGEESDASAAHAVADAALLNIFDAQCARDAAMAEAIQPYVGGESLIIHFNGAFHTDSFLGLTGRVVEAAPGAQVMLISTVGVENPARPEMEEHLGLADFLIVVQEEPEEAR